MAGRPDPRWRARVELLLSVSAPMLDLALAAGDRVSRLLALGERMPPPVRMARPGQAAPRGLRGTR